MKQYIAACAICPYYHSEGPGRICCDGCAGSDDTHLIFKDMKRQREYRRKYCYSYGYKRCPIAQAITREIEKAEYDGKVQK